MHISYEYAAARLRHEGEVQKQDAPRRDRVLTIRRRFRAGSEDRSQTCVMWSPVHLTVAGAARNLI
jgi:hypothetical protein